VLGEGSESAQHLGQRARPIGGSLPSLSDGVVDKARSNHGSNAFWKSALVQAPGGRLAAVSGPKSGMTNPCWR
jgi:hypothetical protein